MRVLVRVNSYAGSGRNPLQERGEEWAQYPTFDAPIPVCHQWVCVLITLQVAYHADKKSPEGQGAWPSGPWEQRVTVEEKMWKKVRGQP